MTDGGPAFPTPEVWGEGYPRVKGVQGMSLRDWFAGMALQGMLAYPGDSKEKRKVWAAVAFQYADAMLKAREGEHD